MADPTLAQLLMIGWVFAPLSDDPFEGQQTIGDLDEQVIEIPEADLSGVDADAALNYYREYVNSPDADPALRLEALRRMGDLQLKAGENAQFDESEYTADMLYHDEAIRYYRELLESQQGYGKGDLVMYQLSRAYESIGALEPALETLDRLVSEYPTSQYIDEAQFRRGELLFVRKRYYDAGLAYQSVVDYGSVSSFYEQSLYKLGWSLFKQAEYDPAIHAFLDLLGLRLAAAEGTATRELPQSEGFGEEGFDVAAFVTAEAIDLDMKFAAMTRPERELVDDTLRALSLTFAYMDGPGTIGAYVDARGGIDPAYLLYTSLGELYLEKERYIDAADTFNAFVLREPNHEKAPQLSVRTIEAYQLGRFPSKVLEAKEAFVMAYGLESEYWSYHDIDERGDVIEPLKANLSDLAQYDHAEAQRTGDMDAYARAADWYRRYLDYFPTDPESAYRSFLLGEILTESAKFDEASYWYQRAAYDYPDYENAAEAGYAALLASRSHLAALEAMPEQADAADAWLQDQRKQALQFAQTFPQHPQAQPVLSDTAESYFNAGEFDESLAIAGVLLTGDMEPAPELALVAWTVTAFSHFDMEHYSRAERAYLELRSRGGTPSLTAVELDEQIAASIYRQGEAERDIGMIDAAVEDFLRVAEVTPNSEIAPQATYDAGILLFNESRWEESVAVMTGFRATYPEHPYNDDITRNLAIAYQQSEQPALAAREFEAIALISTAEPEVRREALWQTAELYEQSGERDEARRVWAQYVEEFPNPVAESIEVRQRLADLAIDANDARARRDWLAAIIATDAAAGEQRSDRTRTLAARATIELAEPKRLAFNAVRLDMPLEASLKRKKSLMEDALSAYNEAAGYGIADVTTIATYRIGELYYQLSQDLMDSERPDGLSEDELEMYEILLEEQAFPFEEKAIEIFAVNTERAALGVYDEWVRKSYEQLAQLMPARYAKYEKAETNVEQLY